MATYDPQKAARVWQRVQGEKENREPPHREDNLQELIMNEWMAAATYLQLARKMGQKEAAVLQSLAREEQNHLSCLKGIHTLITGEKCAVRAPKIQLGTPEATLRRCYGEKMRNLKAYESRTSDPEYGHVFSRLAEQEQEQCREICEKIGAKLRVRPFEG